MSDCPSDSHRNWPVGGLIREVSGGITLERLRGLREIGVDLVSVGALTHSAPGVDLSLLFETT